VEILNIVVCVKQVPDTTAEKRLGADYRLDRAGVESILNPFDEYAIEEALRIKEAQGAEITLLCMGPQSADGALRKGLAMGCDNAVLISDTGLAGTDSLGTAHALATGLKKLKFDLVLMGMQSTDARTGQVPAAMAAFLDLPLLTQAAKLEVDGGKGTARICRQADGGMLVLEAHLPAVISVIKGINEPRYPALRGIMMAKKKEIRLWSITDVGLDMLLVGGAARTKVLSVSKPAPRAKGVVIKDDAATAARKVADYLHEIKVI
jgi:electron transfer flavoprotein beta subunit